VHAGAVLADHGIVQSDAYGTLRDRRLLAVDVAILAEWAASTPSPSPLSRREQYGARSRASRLADALVVSGAATGQATRSAKSSACGAPFPTSRS
jgi:predicted TIM-barrel enzyme